MLSTPYCFFTVFPAYDDNPISYLHSIIISSFHNHLLVADYVDTLFKPFGSMLFVNL